MPMIDKEKGLVLTTDLYEAYGSIDDFVKVLDRDEDDTGDIWECWAEEVHLTLEDFKDDLRQRFGKDAMYVLYGTIGRWNGFFKGGAVCADVDDLMHWLQKEDDLTIKVEGDQLMAYLYHHDSHHRFEIRVIKDVEDFEGLSPETLATDDYSEAIPYE